MGIETCQCRLVLVRGGVSIGVVQVSHQVMRLRNTSSNVRFNFIPRTVHVKHDGDDEMSYSVDERRMD